MTDLHPNPTAATDAGGLFHDPATLADMDAWHAAVDDIRATTPVRRVEAPDHKPFWVLTKHEDVFAVSRDREHWKNTWESVLGPEPAPEQLAQMEMSGMVPRSLVHLDDDDHRQHRAVTNDWFKPAAVRHRQPRIDEIADTFIDKMRDMGGECDFAVDIAQPYTLRVIMDIYGVPEADEPLMLDLTQGVFGANDPEFTGEGGDPEARLLQSLMTFIQYFNEITQDRRARPADDLASIIANGEIDGCPMGDSERLWYYIIVATAGHDTTSFALSGGMEALLRNPDQITALRARVGDEDRADVIARASDEFIRWTTPVRHFLRYPTQDMTIRGVEIPANERVLLSYPSANRDADVFADPHRFDAFRPDAEKLLSFGVGAHFCLGAQFARREIRTFLGKVLDQVDHIEMAGDPSWSLSHFVSGVKHLPISYRFA